MTDLTFQRPLGITPYDEFAPTRRALESAVEQVQGAVRGVHQTYLRAWSSYASDEIVGVIGGLQHRVDLEAQRLMEDLDRLGEKFRQAKAADAGVELHRIDSDLRSMQRSIDHLQEIARAASHVSYLGYGDDDDDDPRRSWTMLVTASKSTLAEAHRRLRVAHLGDEYRLLDNADENERIDRRAIVDFRTPEDPELVAQDHAQIQYAAKFHFLHAGEIAEDE
jgi:hypothetical protein